MPATLSSASRRPNSSTAVRTIASTSASLVTSQCTARAPSPIAPAVSASAPLQSATTTFAPSRAKSCADALPIPEPAPVMTATLPSNIPMANPHTIWCQGTMAPISGLSKSLCPRVRGMTAEELAGKVAIVTGGAGGIGRATAELLVAEGANVVIADLDDDAGNALAAQLGHAAAFNHTDVSDAEQVQALVDFAVERFGGLDIMFNNAGIGSPLTRFLHDDLTDFSRIMGVNLFGVIVGAQRAARHM